MSNKKNTIGLFSLIMINIIAVDSLRTLPISATYGFSLVFFYLLAGVLFLIPVALITAELATAWPSTGGIYIWVREAFGPQWGFFVVWLQWFYNIVWYPTIMAFLAATLAYLFSPSLAENKFYLFSVVLIFFWAITGLNCLGMRVSSWMSTIGALIGTLFPIFLIIALSFRWYWQGNPSQIVFSTQTFFPNFQSLSHFVLFVGVLFGLAGLEMSANHAGTVYHPQKNYPRALFYSTLLILSSLTFGALAIAIVVPAEKLSLVTGLIDAFMIFFKTFSLDWLMPWIILAILVSGLGNVGAWLIGPAKGMLMASRDGQLPARFARLNRHDAPQTILILQGAIFTLFSTVFLFMPTVNSSYWLLSALTAQLALLSYIFMFVAAIKLRYDKPKVIRPYRIPGGNVGMILVASLGILTMLFAIGIGFVPPEQFPTGNLVIYEGVLTIGLLLACGLPFLFSYYYRSPAP